MGGCSSHYHRDSYNHSLSTKRGSGANRRLRIARLRPASGHLVALEVVRPIVSEHCDGRKLVLFDVPQCRAQLPAKQGYVLIGALRPSSSLLHYTTNTYLHDEMRRLHLRTGRQMVQQKVIRLRQPQVHAAQRIIVERPDAHHAQL